MAGGATPSPRAQTGAAGTICDMSDTSVMLENETFTEAVEPWSVLLWNDPVNTMEYVSRVLCKVVKVTRERADEIMQTAHTNGRAVAWSGEKTDAETLCRELHGWGLQATLERGSE